MFYSRLCVLIIIFLCVEARHLDNIKSKNLIFSKPKILIPPRPALPQTLTARPDPFTTQDPTTQARLFFKSDLFSESNGKILYYALLVAEASYQESPESGAWNENNANEWPNLPDWASATSDSCCTKLYQATPAKWQPFDLGNDSDASVAVPFILGTGESDGIYKNGALKPSTEYGLKIRAFTVNGYQDTDVIYFKTLENLAMGMIIIIFTLIFLICLATVLIAIFIEDILKLMPSFSKLVTRRSLSSPIPTDCSSKNFVKYSNELLNNRSRLSNQYHLLGTLSADLATPCLYGQRTENRSKNRYVNILPFDVTRVELSIVNDDPASDYINASFIKGYSESVEYIASQGPVEDTCHDFWRMILQQSAELIIMLTDLVDGEAEKCFKYFPDSGKQLTFGDIKITCVSLEEFKTCDKRILIVARDMRQTTITHFHFKLWPDFGSPKTTQDFLEFHSLVRQTSTKGCWVVHCSAGVGRTGTFIAVDILLQVIKYGQKINLFKTVLQLRKQRMNMVQTMIQYEFLYRTIAQFIENNSRKKSLAI